VHLLAGEPRAHEHRALRWITGAELHELDWVPADRGWIPDLALAVQFAI
jgi:8-oxo-dGTP diphosphatase